MSPKIQVVYIAVTNGPKTHELCARFVGTWIAYPPGIECELLVCCNGGPLPLETALLFAPLDAKFLPRENDSGWDCSAFQDAAGQSDADMMFCCGESVYFHRTGWLLQLAQAWSVFGPGMYGCFSSHSTSIIQKIYPHLNTNAFACAPKHLVDYPRVTNHQERYAFEHGPDALWRRLDRKGVPVKLVTWDGVWGKGDWRKPPNILQRGDQTNCLCFCIHNDRWAAAADRVKRTWASYSDKPFL